MEILTREQARQSGEPKYYTGIPCKNNHLTYRYTQSGTCAGCIRSYNAPMEIVEANQKRRDNLQRLITFRDRVFDSDIAFVSRLLLATAQLREPGAQMRDVWKGGAGVKRTNGTGFHSFECFPEDLAALQATVRGIFDAHNNSLPMIAPKPYEPEPEYWPEGDPT